jgi:hypothetical protein
VKLSDTNNVKRIREQIGDTYAEICMLFSKLDLDSVLDCFSNRDDMVKISNGTILRGKKELAEYWHKRLDDVDKLHISIENVEVHIIDENHVWTTADEFITMGEQVQKAILSNIFVLTNDGWKILFDHTTYVE